MKVERAFQQDPKQYSWQVLYGINQLKKACRFEMAAHWQGRIQDFWKGVSYVRIENHLFETTFGRMRHLVDTTFRRQWQLVQNSSISLKFSRNPTEKGYML